MLGLRISTLVMGFDGSGPFYVALGLAQLNLPLKGGSWYQTSHRPAPRARSAWAGPGLPAFLPPGLEMITPWWLVDPAAVAGFAASNALRSVNP